MRRLTRAAAICLFGLGCSGAPAGGGAGSETARDSTTGPAGGEPSSIGPTVPAVLDPEALCADVIQLQCEGHLRCCRNEDDRYASVEECRSLLEPLCVQDLSGGAYAGGKIAFDGAQYVRTLERLRAAAEACEPVGREMWDPVFVGTLDEGDDCTPDVEGSDYSQLLACRDGLGCVVRGEGTQRMCAPQAARGEPCLDVECGAGLHCGGSGRRPVCEPLRAEGIGCASHTECATGYCAEDGSCGARTVAYRWCEDLTYP